MIIKTLRLVDFGAFQGDHTIDLKPKEKYGKKRPIILFGGLNGAGKTTILEAIRLALYGKQAFGKNLSQQEYENYLREAIHKSSNLLVSPESATVSLEFIYSKLGRVSTYNVTRSWTASTSQVKERLELLCNGDSIDEITADQTQIFLNELIPIGVSELFFFDGEKIKTLAEDEGNIALGQSIYRLLGLDIIERLRSDLSIYMRRFQSQQQTNDNRKQIEELITMHDRYVDEIEKKSREVGELVNSMQNHQKRLNDKEETFSVKGGAWAVSRAQNQIRQQELEKQRKEIEDRLVEELSGLYPFTIISELLRDLETQLEKEFRLKQWRAAQAIVRERKPLFINKIKKELPESQKNKLSKKISNSFDELLNPPADVSKVKLLHDVSDTDYVNFRKFIHLIRVDSRKTVCSLKEKLEVVENQLAKINLQLERAPEEAAISETLNDIKREQASIATLREKKRALIENIQITIRKAQDAIRKAKHLEENDVNVDKLTINVQLAGSVRAMLEDFIKEMRKQKIKELESKFEQAFSQLARKEDMLTRAEINTNTFDVKLFGKNDKAVQKKQLSAGEKQIYAISMLEALALTSGRRLPVIIDTPLGRLDSRHRTNLVNNYFPRASHQVIILSTDTEVDKKFYEELNPYISHAFSINYNEVDGASRLMEGYFWKESAGL